MEKGTSFFVNELYQNRFPQQKKREFVALEMIEL